MLANLSSAERIICVDRKPVVPSNPCHLAECGRGPKTSAQLCASDVVPRDLIDAQRAYLPHYRGELVVHDLEHAIHAGLAERRKAPHIGSANADGGGAQGQRLQDVGATAYAP